MATQRNPECARIEEILKPLLPENAHVECQLELRTRAYIIWLIAGSRSTRVIVPMVDYTQGNWTRQVQAALDALTSK